jgi:DNA-binding MarR family transcriptional regulator
MQKVVKANDEEGEAPDLLTDRAEDLKRLVADLGRHHPLRDPIFSVSGQDLTPPQMHSILWLGTDGELPLHVIAQRIGCSQPTVTGVIDRLEKLGLVERERDTDDRRVVKAHLTAPGRSAYEQLDRVVTEHLSRLLGFLPAADQEQLLRIIESLVDRVREHAARPPPVDTP